MKMMLTSKARFAAVGMVVMLSNLCFAQDDDSYGAITSNAGTGPVEWVSVEQGEGPSIASITASAKTLFDKDIKATNLPAVKSYYVKGFNGSRHHVESWQPIDHTTIPIVGLTAPIDAEGNYYLYNCEIEYSRPIGTSTWTLITEYGYRMYLSDTPKSDGIHLIGPDGTDKTQEADLERQKQEAKAARDAMNSQNDKKGKKTEAIDSDDESEPEEKSEGKKPNAKKLLDGAKGKFGF